MQLNGIRDCTLIVFAFDVAFHETGKCGVTSSEEGTVPAERKCELIMTKLADLLTCLRKELEIATHDNHLTADSVLGRRCGLTLQYTGEGGAGGDDATMRVAAREFEAA